MDTRVHPPYRDLSSSDAVYGGVTANQRTQLPFILLLSLIPRSWSCANVWRGREFVRTPEQFDLARQPALCKARCLLCGRH